MPQWTSPETWNALATATFNILTGWQSNFQWLIEVAQFIGAKFYNVDLAWTLSTTWSTLTSSVFNVLSSWSLQPMWTVLAQTTYNTLTSWQSAVSWTLDVYHWISTGITYYIDLAWQTIATWNLDVSHIVQVIDWGIIALGFALIAFCLVAAAVTTKKRLNKEKVYVT
jgi:hypothetical protein